MSSKLRRRMRGLAWAGGLAMLLANALAYGAAWAACRRGLRPARGTLRPLGVARSAHRLSPPPGLDCERHGFTSDDGTFLEAWLVPQARSRALAVLFHGYGGSKGDLLREARAFRELGLDTLLVDFRGSGGSEGSETSIGFHEARDVHAAVAYARSLPGRPRVVAYGISMGAAAVLKADADGDLDAAGLVLECPFDRLLTTVNHRFEERNVPAFPLSPLLVFWGGWRQGFDAFAHNPVDYARRARTPALLLNGANDTYVTRSEARAIARALDARGRLVLCPGIGHASCLRGQADLWRDSVGAFLDTVLVQR